MTIDDFITVIDDKLPPAPAKELAAFEQAIGHQLPTDYRRFLVACNGGYVSGSLWFKGPTPEGRVADAGIHHVGGFRDESCVSLTDRRQCFGGRIPRALVWIMDDPFDNAIFVDLSSSHQGQVYFWDHEFEADEDWDGEVHTTDNVQLLANSFTEFVAGLQSNE